MKSLKKVKSRANFNGYTDCPIKYLGYICMTMDRERSLNVKIIHACLLTTTIILYVMQIAFIGLGCGTLQDRYQAIIFVNYYTVSLGKHFSIAYYRLDLIDAFEEFKKLSLSIDAVRQYGLEIYFKNYKFIERFIYNFFVYICLLYMFQPIFKSFFLLWINGEFDLQTPIYIWPSVSDYFGYGSLLVSNVFASFLVGFNIVSADVSLLSCLSQLCAHFDFLSKRIMELKPENEESLGNLNAIIKDHQKILRLARGVNLVFAPSIAATLSSSSFIICFIAYQMLDDISLIKVVMAFLLLCYECKQVILICFYGDKLIEMSANLFDAIYMHKWYNGSLRYRRQIAFLLMKTCDPVVLKIAGSLDVSLITLKQVFGNAYQIFAVLKTA